MLQKLRKQNAIKIKQNIFKKFDFFNHDYTSHFDNIMYDVNLNNINTINSQTFIMNLKKYYLKLQNFKIV